MPGPAEMMAGPIGMMAGPAGVAAGVLTAAAAGGLAAPVWLMTLSAAPLTTDPAETPTRPAGVKIGAKGFMLSWRVDDSGKSSMNETMFDLKIKSGKVTRQHWMGKKRRTAKGTPTIIYILAERVFGLAEGDVCITPSLTLVECVCYCIKPTTQCVHAVSSNPSDQIKPVIKKRSSLSSL